MDERTKRKAEDELTEIVNEFKRGKLSIDTENGRRIEEKSPGKPSPLELPGVRHSSGYPPENGPPRSSRQVSREVRVDVVDKNTLIWLESKQNVLLFNEEYGVEISRLETPSSDTEAKAETQLDDNVSRPGAPVSDVERKPESPDSPCFRISMETSGTCDYEDAQWFVKQASNFLRLIASEGVYAKCFWYEGPIPRGSDGSPAVSSVVKKIKGHDGKNLERIQERTGVIIGVVLNNKAISVAQSGITDLPHRVIGVRLRCVRMRGVRDASKKIQQLLGLAGDYFLRETSLDAKERETADSDSPRGGSSPLPPSSFGVKRNLVPRTGGQCSTSVSLPLYTPFEKQEGKSREGYLYRDVAPDAYAPPSRVLCREPPHTEVIHEEPDDISHFEARNTSNLLYIYNLPGHIPVRILKSIFQKVLAEKLDLPYTREVVIHAIVASDESYAIIQLASEGFVAAALRLYSEDKTVFDGLKVGLPRVMISKATPARPSYYSGAVEVKNIEPISYPLDDRYLQKDSFPYGSRRNPEPRFSEHDYRHNRKSIPWWDQVTDEEPNTLFLTELTIHTSAQSIRNLFEDILTHYIGPPLVSSSGRKLVLDVRYVHSKQCAFVDMATPELVDFMLDLHSQRPELFDFMKMEIGNKYINENKEEQLARPDWVQHDIRPGGYPPVKPRGIPHVEPLGGHGFIGRNVRGMRSFDFTQETSDNYYSTFDFRKRPKSDPEKTVFAYSFPPNATGKIIYQIFERVLFQNRQGLMHDEIVTEVRMPSNSYAFIVFATVELTRLALQLYAQDRDIYDKIQLRPHIDSKMEERFWDCFQEHDHEFRGAARSVEFSNKNHHRLEDHPSTIGSYSKSQPWEKVNPSTEHYIHAPSSH